MSYVLTSQEEKMVYGFLLQVGPRRFLAETINFIKRILNTDIIKILCRRWVPYSTGEGREGKPSLDPDYWTVDRWL